MLGHTSTCAIKSINRVEGKQRLYLYILYKDRYTVYIFSKIYLRIQQSLTFVTFLIHRKNDENERKRLFDESRASVVELKDSSKAVSDGVVAEKDIIVVSSDDEEQGENQTINAQQGSEILCAYSGDLMRYVMSRFISSSLKWGKF